MPSNKKTLYKGKIITLEIEQVTLPNGDALEMEIVHHPGGAAVVALDEQQKVCLLRQYRHICKDWIWELPAGKIDDEEAPLKTAQRELQEEAGMKAANWQSLGNMVSSPGVFTEIVHCYLATELTACELQHEPGELIEVHWLPLQEAYEWAISNKINDAKSVIALCRAYAEINL